MEDQKIANIKETESWLLEAFLKENRSDHLLKNDFKASLKERLTKSLPYKRRNQVLKAWAAGIGVILAGAAVYGLGYYFYRNYYSRP